MNDYPKVTVVPTEDYEYKIFIGETELPFDAWEVEAKFFAVNDMKVTLSFAASAVEFKSID